MRKLELIFIKNLQSQIVRKIGGPFKNATKQHTFGSKELTEFLLAVIKK